MPRKLLEPEVSYTCYYFHTLPKTIVLNNQKILETGKK